MPNPDPRAAARMEAATGRTTKLHHLIEALDWAAKCDRTHARTNRDDDYLTLLQARYEASKLWDEVMEACTDDYREELSCEAFSQCSYSMEESCYLNDNGDPKLPGQHHLPHGYNDWRYDVRRDAEMGL